MAPISDTEICFLRFGHPEGINKHRRFMTTYTPGSVAIYNVVTGSVTDVADTSGFAFITSVNTCTMTKKGQIAAIVLDKDEQSKMVTYTKGESKVRVYNANG